MPRILNLNDFGGKLIAVAAVLVTIVPALLYLLSLLFRAFQMQAAMDAIPLLLALTRASLGLGMALFGLLLVLVILEQVQDHWIERQYDHHRARRLPAADGLFECQFCGNRRVRAEDKVCGVCGKDLETPV